MFKFKPTRKWKTLFLTDVATIVGSWIVTGAFDDVERGLTASSLLALATTFYVSNDSTPRGDGVPS